MGDSAKSTLGACVRILFSFPHALGAPGIGWTAWQQVTGLAARGHEVHVVAASLARPLPDGVIVTTSLARGRARIPHRVIGRDRAFAWHDRVAARQISSTSPDLVHVWPLAPGVTARVARDRGIPVVREAPNTHTAHAWRVVAAEVDRLGLTGRVSSAHSENAAHLRMEEAEWAAASAILAPSDAVAETFLAAGFAPDRVVRHQYGYALTSRRVAPRVAGRRGLRAVFAGYGEPRKGLHHALDAWLSSSAHADGTFTVVGRMMPAYADLLSTQLAHDSVQLAGFTNDIAGALGAADVLVLPTLEEGSALVTYEAQGVGCVPLVSTAAGALLDDGVHGLLHTPGDVAALTAQFDRLATDRDALARMSTAALDHARDLTWAAAAERLEAAYLGVVQPGGATSLPRPVRAHSATGEVVTDADAA